MRDILRGNRIIDYSTMLMYDLCATCFRRATEAIARETGDGFC